MIPPRLRPILDEVAPLGEVFAAAGHRLYLVGGVVRDLLLGRDLDDAADLDFTTDATPPEVRALIAPMASALWTQGERFGTIGAKVGGRTLEITTHRGEAYRPDSRKPDVVFSTEIDSDLARARLHRQRAGDRAARADADRPARRRRRPRRRGACARRCRRRSRSPTTRCACSARRASSPATASSPTRSWWRPRTRLAGRLEVVSAERIRDELDKLLVVDDPSRGLWFLVDTGLADHFLPELTAMKLEQDPVHRHKDVLAHTIAVVANTSPRRLLRLAALLHDVGKPHTRAFGENGVSFHHHEVVGARMARDRMRALHYSNNDVAKVRKLVFLHLRFHTYGMGWTDSAVRRFVRDAGDELDDLIELTRCDCTTRNQRKADMLARRMDELEARIAALAEAEELAAVRPDLDGEQVMAHLGIGPGRDVGDALKMLLELRLDEGPVDRDVALAHLDAWWATRRGTG